MMSVTAADTVSWVDAGDKQFAENFIHISQKYASESWSHFAFNFEEIKVAKMLKQQNERKKNKTSASWLTFLGVNLGSPIPVYLLPKPFPVQASQGFYSLSVFLVREETLSY